ncbi:hypothetical protein Ancab_005918 [Ancistrocladus abbreviatus]
MRKKPPGFSSRHLYISPHQVHHDEPRLWMQQDRQRWRKGSREVMIDDREKGFRNPFPCRRTQAHALEPHQGRLHPLPSITSILEALHIFSLLLCQLYIFWQTSLYEDALETKADSERSASSPGHPQTIYCPSPCMALSADLIEMFHLLMASFSAILMLTLKATIKTARKCFVNFEC